MVFTESAQLMTAQDLVDMINDGTGGNPTINDMVFIEVRTPDTEPSKVFPCYVTAWRDDHSEEKETGKVWKMFQADIIQMRDGEFGILKVFLHEQEFDSKKRIWDKPPTLRLRQDTPFVEPGVQ